MADAGLDSPLPVVEEAWDPVDPDAEEDLEEADDPAAEDVRTVAEEETRAAEDVRAVAEEDLSL